MEGKEARDMENAKIPRELLDKKTNEETLAEIRELPQDTGTLSLMEN